MDLNLICIIFISSDRLHVRPSGPVPGAHNCQLPHRHLRAVLGPAGRFPAAPCLPHPDQLESVDFPQRRLWHGEGLLHELQRQQLTSVAGHVLCADGPGPGGRPGRHWTLRGEPEAEEEVRNEQIRVKALAFI